MNANEKIKARRLALGLSEATVASRLGIGIHAYCDLEQHADEIFTVVDLRTVRALCQALEIDFEGLFDWNDPDVPRVRGEGQAKPRQVLIRSHREASGMSIAEVADRLGFDESAIEELETDPNALERYPLGFVSELAELLHLTPRALLS